MIDWTQIKPRKAVKNPFNRTGFDSLVSSRTSFSNGFMVIGADETCVFDGGFTGTEVSQGNDRTVNKTTLVVGGRVEATTVWVSNVTITGRVECELITVEGHLSIKAGATLKAREIRYRALTIEDGAVVLGQMNHLDHISAGEQT